MTPEEIKKLFPDMEMIEMNPGNFVCCDLCNEDYTNSEETGGMLFCSKAVCPKCLPDFKASVEKCHEEKFIRATANEGEQFRNFVYRIREPKISKEQTILGEDIPETTRGIVYLCELTEKELIVNRTIICDDAFAALQYYSNIPNPESQLVMGKTYDELIQNLNNLHKQMKSKRWLKNLHNEIE